jgi:2-keto-4-pentenoate hydratase
MSPTGQTGARHDDRQRRHPRRHRHRQRPRDDWPEILAAAGAARRPVSWNGALAACTHAQALALQAQHVQRTLARIGGGVIGAKLGGTNEAALKSLGLDSPFTGPIFSARSARGPAVMQRGDFLACILEAEVGVRLGRALDASAGALTREQVRDAIEALFPCIEIADSRYARWTEAPPAAVVADLGYAGAWVQGEDCAGWREIDLVSMRVTLSRDGETVREGQGALVLGDPLRSLTLAVNELAGAASAWPRAPW